MPANQASVGCGNLRVLILGGTGFIGPEFVRAALERGHRVAVFNRGESRADLPRGVERLVGDRNGDLAPLRNRDWDLVFDLATFFPAWVRSVGQALQGRVRHYTFISSLLAYQYPGATDEQSKLEAYTAGEDPFTVTSRSSATARGLKVLCEQEAERQFAGKALILRAGNIVGPRERQGLFTYLVARLAQGGEILAAGDPSAPVQLIDARDMAEWAVRSAEAGRIGAFNVTGPAMPLSWSELLGGVRALFSVPTQLTWVPLGWLMERGLQPYSALLFWPSQMGIPGLNEVAVAKAVSEDLTFRPLAATAADTLTWYRGESAQRQREALLGFDSNNKALEHSMARERDLLAVWHFQNQARAGRL